MKVLVADQDLVNELLPMAECIEVMADALKGMVEGRFILPLRSWFVLPDATNLLAWMPAYAESIKGMGIKVLSVFPNNHGTVYDSHIGVVLLFETENGLLKAIVDATAVTAIRTAAVSAVATRLLARPDARNLAIIGAGTQARTHLEAMLQVRKIRRVRIYNRTQENAVRLAEQASGKYRVKIEVAETAKEAVSGSDLICTTTSSKDPVICGDWITPGAHINAVGAFRPDTRELDTKAVVKSRLYADKIESMLTEAGEYLIPQSEGAIDERHIVGELGEVLAGRKPGRKNEEEITLFKSLGIAIEDLAAANHILKNAREKKKGTFLKIGGRPFGQSE
jgi:ornithine cyclodeaminase